MIIHTGMRTDIPAFYTPWFLKRLEEGFVLVRNPYDPSAVTCYLLSPEVVDLLVFCTKNPAPMLPHLDRLSSYGQYWFVTITPYGRDMEPNVPPKEKVMEDFWALSDRLGKESVCWRYDPVLLTDTYTVQRHLRDFETMARTLRGATNTCVISFIDLYEKVKRNFPEVREVEQKDRLYLGKAFAEIAGAYGMTVKACAEGDELSPYGVDCSGCMTLATFEAALHARLNAPKTKPTRKECACYLSCDIGAYHSCGHLCRYCYANDSEETVQQNRRRHDPSSPFLLGTSMPGDRVHQAKQETWLDGQQRF
ncbi:MAG: DUF1848 domain-containing protein [Clostridiales bacterium]|nr:DUF1848 domain-containing protein [Clostridiales bacterium]